MNLDDPFAARMREQIRLIERYRQRVLSREGRQLDGDTAAFEWIARHAASFPSPERYAASPARRRRPTAGS
ncbi:hypothetical protein [Accumulibacter sp.]|uniref:hypothetical protein n=1 Tax=Accumulibacter sp. TaxID=2053492 RepID=UPI0025E5022A|nr:hypothetical protein [Accumulibacter sp.]MCM8595389.1 hypothetical protein [Accumulibacter sp.]MCM8626430.1 hypothetical protein [Accumulibacter sp.]MDS4049536.1 hypothetical protein [Accumulibacter sp.]